MRKFLEETMNILMMVSWYTPQGADKLEAGVFHYEQAMDLKKYCNVAMYFPFDKQIAEKETKEEEWGITTYRSKYKTANVLQAKIQIKRTMKHIMEEFKPDVIHAHCAAGAGFYAIAEAKRYGIPVVITEHTPLEISRADKIGIGRIFSKIAYTNSQANVCVSKSSQSELRRAFPQCEFSVIYNGIIAPSVPKKQRTYYKEGYINAVIVAVLYDLEIKGLKYLLHAMKLVKEQGKKIVLHHIGGGEYLQYFQQMARELEIEDVCIFHGRCDRDELYAIEEEMDFFVSSSLVECSGVSVQEAMLLGKPVLGTNSGGVDSLVPKEAGMIVEKANVEALRDGLIDMAEHIEKYDKEHIKQYAYDNFEIGNISQTYMELYKTLCTERSM